MPDTEGSIVARAVSITRVTFTCLFLEDVARPAESRFPSCVSTEKSRFRIPIYTASLPPGPARVIPTASEWSTPCVRVASPAPAPAPESLVILLRNAGSWSLPLDVVTLW